MNASKPSLGDIVVRLLEMSHAASLASPGTANPGEAERPPGAWPTLLRSAA